MPEIDERVAMVDTPRGQLGVPVWAQQMAGGQEPSAAAKRIPVTINGTRVFFDTMPSEADIDEAAQQLGLQRETSVTTTPVTPPQGTISQIGSQGSRIFGALEGGRRGLALGSRSRNPWLMALSAAGGAALGAGGMEAAQAGLEKLFGVPTGNVGQRIRSAGIEGPMNEAAARAVPFALGRFAKPAATAAPEVPAITTALEREAGKAGSQLDKTTFARTIRGPLRQMLRSVEREAKAGTKAQKAALRPVLGSLRPLVDRTVSLAPVADALAKDPVMLGDLLRQGPAELLPELQSSWLTATAQLSPAKALAAWNELGQEGQRVLFSTRAPALRKLFESAAASLPKVAKTPRGSLARGLWTALEAVGAHRVFRMHSGAWPFLLGKVLAGDGAAEFITSALGRGTSGSVAGRVAGQVLLPPAERATQDVMRPLFATP